MGLINSRMMQLIASKLELLGFRTDNDNVIKTKKVTIGFADSVAGAEVETDFVFPTKCKVLGVTLDVTTLEATGGTKTIIIGTTTATGDPNGFANGVSVAAAAIVEPTLANGAQTLGELLCVDEDGAGALVPRNDVSSGGETLTWTPGSNDFAELAADIYVTYIDLT